MAHTEKQIDHLEQAYLMYEKYPDSRSQILTYLPQLGLTEEQFSEYQISREQEEKTTREDTLIKGIYEERAEQNAISPYHTQSVDFTDKEIVELFDRKAELESYLDEEPLYKEYQEMRSASEGAKKEYDLLLPYHSSMIESEWEDLSTEFAGPTFIPISYFSGLLQEFGIGFMDLLDKDRLGKTTSGVSEQLHERGLFTSWNPFTLFGSLEVAETKLNPEGRKFAEEHPFKASLGQYPEGSYGFSQELEDLEDAMAILMDIQKQSVNIEDKYKDVYGAYEELIGIDKTIMQNVLIDPGRIDELTEERR